MDAIRRTDQVLGTDPRFGDPAAIRARTMARYRLGLTMLARRHPDAGTALADLARREDAQLIAMLLDPVLANAFEDDMARLETGTGGGSSLGHLLAAGAGTGPGGPSAAVAGHPRPLWPERGPAWLWFDPDAASDGPVAARLRHLYGQTFPGGTATPVPATDALHEAVRRGADLLTALLPGAGGGVLPHVGLVGFARGGSDEEQLYSVSGGDPLPSAIFLAPEQLDDPWLAAELLLHEGLHLKLFDVVRSGALVADTDRQVPIPWRTGSWTLVRVVFALHVYAHLVLFRAAAVAAGADLREEYGPPPVDDTVDEPTPGSPAAARGTHLTTLERATYLAEQAGAAHADGLTPDGRRFVGWLVDAVAALAPTIRPRGAAHRPAAAPRDVRPLAGGYRRVEPAVACLLPEQGRLLVMTDEQPRARWLNGHAWLLYALCDGRDTAAIERGYRTALPGTVPAATAAAHLRDGLADLVECGLVTATPHPSTP